MGTAGSPGRVPLEALILAFTHSRAKTLVGTDALRSVLSTRYRELLHEGVFDLEPIWALCAEQPGFQPDHVRPALCRFKTWEEALGLSVQLPRAMQGMTERQIAELASHVQIPMRERASVFGGARAAVGVPAEPGPEPGAADRAGTQALDLVSSVPATTKTPRLRRISRGRRRALEIGSLVLAIAGFSAAGLQMQRGCRTQRWAELSPGFAGDIPLVKAERQGPEVGGELQGERWLALPASVRTAQMKAALEALPHDVQAFFVRDGERHVRAVARWFGEPRQVHVTLE